MHAAAADPGLTIKEQVAAKHEQSVWSYEKNTDLDSIAGLLYFLLPIAFTLFCPTTCVVPSSVCRLFGLTL